MDPSLRRLRVAEILYGELDVFKSFSNEGIDQVLVDAQELFRPVHQKGSDFYDEILLLIERSDDYTVIARIVAAAVYAYPKNRTAFLRKIVAYSRTSIQRRVGANIQFQMLMVNLGLIFGLLLAIRKLDDPYGLNQWNEEFEEELAEAWSKLLFPGYEFPNSRIGSLVEEDLKKLIRDYVDPRLGVGPGVDIGEAEYLQQHVDRRKRQLSKVLAGFKGREAKETKAVLMLINLFCYAIFSSWSVSERLQAMIDYLPKQINR